MGGRHGFRLKSRPPYPRHMMLVRCRRAGTSCAGPDLPGNGCCREWRQAASWAVVGRMRGGERCRRTVSGAALRGWHVCRVKQQVVKAWQWQVDNTSPRTVTARGRAMIPAFGAALQHRIWHAAPPNRTRLFTTVSDANDIYNYIEQGVHFTMKHIFHRELPPG